MQFCFRMERIFTYPPFLFFLLLCWNSHFCATRNKKGTLHKNWQISQKCAVNCGIQQMVSCYHFVVVSGLLTASPWRYTNETKILHTKWHIEYLLDMSNWLHDVHGGQGSQFCPFFHVFSLKRQSALGTLRGPDTINFHQASTLRLKGIHRHP